MTRKDYTLIADTLCALRPMLSPFDWKIAVSTFHDRLSREPNFDGDRFLNYIRNNTNSEPR